MADESDPTASPQIDLGGVLISRAELSKELPNIERFERCLADAKQVNHDMAEHGGGIPQYATNWSDVYKGEVITTLQELGDLYVKASKELKPGESPQ